MSKSWFRPLPGRKVMSVPGIFKLGRVSIMLQIWHLDFMHFFASIGTQTMNTYIW